MQNDKLNSLICKWLELNLKKLHAIENQYYEKAAYARDEEKKVELKIVKVANLDCEDDCYSRKEIRLVAKEYLSSIGIDISDINTGNLKQSLREIKLLQVGIK